MRTGARTPALHALEPVMEVEKFNAKAGMKIAPVKKCPMATRSRGFPERPAHSLVFPASIGSLELLSAFHRAAKLGGIVSTAPKGAVL